MSKENKEKELIENWDNMVARLPTGKSPFEIWWENEGSGMRPYKNEDAENHAKRVAAIAWANSDDKARFPK